MKYRSKSVVSLVEEESEKEEQGGVRRASWTAGRRGSLLSGLFASDSESKRRASFPAGELHARALSTPPAAAPWTLAPPFLTAPEYAREKSPAAARPAKGKGRKGSGGGSSDEGGDMAIRPPTLDSQDRGSKPRRGRFAHLFNNPVGFLRSSSPNHRAEHSVPRPRLSHSSSSSSSGSSWFAGSETDSVSSGYSFEGHGPENGWRPSGPWIDQAGVDPLDTDAERTPNLSLRQSLLDRRRLRSSSSIHTISTCSSYATAVSKTPSELEMTISTYFDRKSVFLALPPFPSSAPSTPTYAPTLETVWEPTWPSPNRQRCSA